MLLWDRIRDHAKTDLGLEDRNTLGTILNNVVAALVDLDSRTAKIEKTVEDFAAWKNRRF